jgi:hypothetical protein
MKAILLGQDNPLTTVRVIVNEANAVSYFESFLREFQIPGEVVVKQE